MTVIENQTTVACRPEELFDYCVDLSNELEWNPAAMSMRRWVHDAGGPIAVRFTGTVEPAEGGSRLSGRFDARPRGWFRLLSTAFLVMARRQEKANMTHLRKALERGRSDT